MNTRIDADYSIAMGATLHASNLLKVGGELYADENNDYHDILSQNIGIEVAGGKMHTILPRGHPFNKAGKEQSFKTCDDN